MTDRAFKIAAVLWTLVALALIGAKLWHVLAWSWWIVLSPIALPIIAVLIYIAWFLLFISTTDFRS